MAKSRYLSDENGNKFYPCAHASATYDNNGKTVETRLNEIENTLEDLSTEGTFTPTDKSNLATAYNHSQSAHAPVDAQKNVQSDWNATSGDAFIKNKPTIPSEVTESTVSNWGFTKNTGTYSKPSTGIPKTDLDSSVQTSLDKADTALQSFTETDPTVPDWAKSSTKPSYTASEVGALPDNTTISDFGITATVNELNYVDGVTSNIQTQLNSKSANGHTHDDRYYTESEIDSKISDINSSISSHTGNTSNPHSVTKTQVGLGNVENKSSATIRGELTKSNVTTALGYTPYTPNEVDNKFSALETNIDWKESVDTFDDIAITYPSPVDGWTVNVKDTDYTYRYNGTSWVAISANAIPKATNSVDGLLSKEDHTNYEDANSKKHTHSNKSVLDGISSTNVSNWNSAKTHADSTHARTDATKVEKSSTNGNIKINDTETTVYTHPGSGTNPHGTTKSDVGLGNVGNFKAVSTVASQGLTDTEKSNARTNIGAGTSSFSGSYTDLSNKPTLGTASSKDVASSGNASTSQVVMGNDTRLTDSRKASDVYSWAKSSTKPTYTASEVGLGNVPNVATNDQTPSYTEATSLAKLTSGEKISVAFGKISKAITDLISHIGDSVKHITSTERTNWSTAYAHSQSTHAPSGAQANVIETVKVNGTALTPSSKAVDITVPSVGNGTVTIKQAGTSKGTFTMNQSGNTTIELTDNNTTYSSKAAASGGTDVSLVTTGEKYTWNNKANASHGNHVPTTGTADNATFLRNDNTWQKVTPANIGAAASSHTHSSYVNQNAFSSVVVGSTTVAADSATDTLTLVAGSNVTITPDATNDKITIAATDTKYSDATTSASGLMSSSDKTKLNGIATGANNYTHPTSDGSKHIPANGTSNGGKYLKATSTAGSYEWGSLTKSDVTTALGYTPPTTDTNTWRGIQNNLTSDSTTDSLSAAQGKVLKGLVDGKVENTETGVSSALYKLEIDEIPIDADSNACFISSIENDGTFKRIPFSSLLNKVLQWIISAGMDGNVRGVKVNNTTKTPDENGTVDIGTFLTAHPTISTSTDSTSTASPSAGGTFTAVDSVTRDSNGHVTKVNTKTVTLPSNSVTVDSALSSTSTNPVQNKVINSALSGKASSTHTHNYAGSSSAGGSATSAVKLDTTSAGSTTQPVYFSGGKPVACSYTLGKSVPSDAVFTDTTYGIATDSSNGLMASTSRKELEILNSLKNSFTATSYTVNSSSIIFSTNRNDLFRNHMYIAIRFYAGYYNSSLSVIVKDSADYQYSVYDTAGRTIDPTQIDANYIYIMKVDSNSFALNIAETIDLSNLIIGTSDNYGLAKISTSTSVTSYDTGLVLSAAEKNSNVSGSLAAQIATKANKNWTLIKDTSSNTTSATTSKSLTSYTEIKIEGWINSSGIYVKMCENTGLVNTFAGSGQLRLYNPTNSSQVITLSINSSKSSITTLTNNVAFMYKVYAR